MLWLKSSIPGLRMVDNISRPVTLYCDNKAVIFFSQNNKLSGVAKHIDIKYHTINLKHISTKKMFTDPLTKSLPPNIFQKHVTSFGLLKRL
jgi:hypothetical protein